MMFFLHRLTEQFKGFNVFYYVTFRAVLAAITAFAISLLFGNFVIRKLISLKIGQPIRTASEVRHLAELHGGKQGTPTINPASEAAAMPRPAASNSARIGWLAASSGNHSTVAAALV